MIILSEYHWDWAEFVASRGFTSFSFDLTYWPTFWSKITDNQTWPRFCQGGWWFWARVFTRFFLWFDSLTSFFTRHDPYAKVSSFVKVIIPSKFGPKFFTSRVFTSFFYDLTYWPTIFPDITHIWTWCRLHQGNSSEQISWILGLKLWPLVSTFDPTQPLFELELDFVKVIILSYYHGDWAENCSL